MDLSRITAQVVSISKEVKAFIHEHRNQVSANQVELKSLNSLVSFVDKTAEERLVKGLREILPEAGFIAEEGTETRKGERYNWIVDPLDGTTNFLHGIPVFAISIALMDGDEVVMGMVWEIGQDECFTAWKG
ncbi:MAG: inositol monophosphatase family protein, partial [Owenweeksia sp.]